MRESHCKSAAHDATQSTTELLVYSEHFMWIRSDAVGQRPPLQPCREKAVMERAVAFQGVAGWPLVLCNYAQRGLLDIDQFLNRQGRACATIPCLAARHRATSATFFCARLQITVIQLFQLALALAMMIRRRTIKNVCFLHSANQEKFNKFNS